MPTPLIVNKNKDRFWLAAGIGCFVVVFLLVFRPFGLEHDGWRDPVFWLILGFAPFNAAMVIGLDVVIRKLATKWSFFANRQVSLVVTVSIIIIGNALYQIIPQQQFNWINLPEVLWEVALIALFPTLFILLYYRNRNASPAPATGQTLTLKDESERETLTVPLASLLYMTAERNYVLIYTTTSDQPLLLRTSLKALAEQLQNTPVVRCHRSFLVNTQQIMHTKKLARNMALTLHHTSQSVPVSASYIPAIETAMQAA